MIKFGSLRGSLGHLILNTLSFFLEKKQKNSLLIISTPKHEISNTYVYEILVKKFKNKKIIFTNSIVLNFIYKIIYKLSKKYQLLSKLICNIEWLHHENSKQEYGSKYNFDENFYHLVPQFQIDKNDIEYFNNWRKKNSFKKKYVCISSRDPGFYNEQIENPRNFSFKYYDLLIRMLLDEDYTVVRMGRKYEDNYNFGNKNYIELYEIEKNNKKLDLIETLLFKYCEFIVSGNSGIDAFAALFKKKIFIPNNFPAGRIPRYLDCTFIPQIYSLNNQILNFEDIPKKILLSEDIDNLKNNNIKLIKTNSLDILEMVRNYLNNKNFEGVSVSKRNFIKEGTKSNSTICSTWYKNNYNLFS